MKKADTLTDSYILIASYAEYKTVLTDETVLNKEKAAIEKTINSKYDIGQVIHLFEKGDIAVSQSTIKSQGLFEPFAPVQIESNNEGIAYIPAF
jgi:hypothetical protein